MRSLLSQELQIVDCESLHSFSRVIFQVLKQKLQLCGYEKYQLISLFYVPKQYRKGKKLNLIHLTCFGISMREAAASWVKVCRVTMTMGVEG